MTTADLTVSPPAASELAAGAGDPIVTDDVTAAATPAPAVTDAQVRGLLAGLGHGLHRAVGHPDVPDHWQFTADELDMLTPAIVRIAERRPQLARAIARGDSATVALLLGGWTARNVTAGRRAGRLEEPPHDHDHPAAPDQPTEARAAARAAARLDSHPQL